MYPANYEEEEAVEETIVRRLEAFTKGVTLFVLYWYRTQKKAKR
jgi:hypothetical protein